MIQFSGKSADNKKKFIGIGLSKENVRRLKNDEPAIVDLEPHGYPNVELIIFFGNTEEEMEATVRGMSDVSIGIAVKHDSEIENQNEG